jgi:LAO/AO transport system kinase
MTYWLPLVAKSPDIGVVILKKLETRISSALNGDRSSIARLLTMTEKAGPGAKAVQEAIFPYTGKAHIIGITGPAGAGKSTLINKLAASMACNGRKTAIIACDPSSPVSGGALLGDRIRMHDLLTHKQIFVRSIATRESAGALPLAAFSAADIFDACGYEYIIIETVGTGQNQIDIMQAAHTIVTVSAPGLGDDIQAMKSGLLELADIHVISKSDLAGAAKTLMDIENATRMRQKNEFGTQTWIPPTLPIVGLTGDGIPELHKAIQNHYQQLEHSGDLPARCQRILRERIYQEAVNMLTQSLRSPADGPLMDHIDQVMQRKMTPAQAAKTILE